MQASHTSAQVVAFHIRLTATSNKITCCVEIVHPGRAHELIPICYRVSSDLRRAPWWLQILKDVSEEHAKKTITVDPFPHGNFTAASIHPCKHSAVMKKMISMANGSANHKELIVDQ